MSSPKLTVLPLGPGGPESLTLRAAELLRSGGSLYVRTARHPVVDWLTQQGIAWTYLDDFYDRYEDFDRMHSAMADYLLEQARKGPLLYGVPDPTCDRSVRLLTEKAAEVGLSVAVLPGVTLSGCCLAACADLTGSSRVLTVSATDFIASPYDPACDLLITELDSRLLSGMVKLKLSDYLEDDAEVYFLPPSSDPVRKRKALSLCETDRQKHYDQTAALWVPGSGYMSRKRFCFRDLEEIMARLRARDGCPWDSAQTHASLRPYLVEEAWEAVDAIDREDPEHLSDELGDVLLQVVFHASIAADFDEFTLTDILTHICRKMLLRHPRLFSGAAVLPVEQSDADSVRDWEKLKRQENGRSTVGESLEDVSPALPSLRFAEKLLQKMSGLPGLRREPAEVAEEIRAGSAGLLRDGRVDEEALAELLIACAELCRLSRTEGEVLLHGAALRLKEAFRAAEAAALAQGRSPDSLTLPELKALRRKEEK